MKAERYASDCHPDFVRIVTEELPYWSFTKAKAFYLELVPKLDGAHSRFLFANDRYALLTLALKRKDMIHEWLYDRCREVEISPDGHLDLWARYHGKTSIITIAGAIQEVINDPEVTIAIFGNTAKISRPFLRAIKEELETNEDLKRLFADVLWANPRKEAPIWSAEMGILVKRLGNPKELTVSAFGIIDGLPTGGHWQLLIFDDIVTQDSVTNTDTEQVAKTWLRWEQAQNLGTVEKIRRWHIGTRYCTVGTMRITMADWSQRPIKDVRIGDEVVGWKLSEGKRYLEATRVTNRGVYFQQPVRKFGFSNGRSVTSTKEHRWWRGPWGSGNEYQALAFPRMREGRKNRICQPRGTQNKIRQLMIPQDVDPGRDAGWLAGFFDGEGTISKNKYHHSGSIHITQSMANPGLIDETRVVLSRLGFAWTEGWHSPSKVNPEKQGVWSDRCVFNINGGWRERYRFLAQIAPARRTKLAETLFAQLTTEPFDLVSDDDAGCDDVHWLETETGNYIVEGFCSSNSFSDAYGKMIDDGILKPRIYPATHDGTIRGRPVLLSEEKWAEIKRDQRLTLPAQQLLNPLAGEENTFLVTWLRSYELRPQNLTVWILVDGAGNKPGNAKSDNCAIIVIGMDPASNFYLLDGFSHRMKLSERTEKYLALNEKWRTAPGVQIVRTAWERYGAMTDIEHVEIEARRRGAEGVSIEEVNWVREGSQSKKARISRLEPDFRESRFWLPKYIHVNGVGTCTWHVEVQRQELMRGDQPVIDKVSGKPIMEEVEGSAKIVTTPYRGPTKAETIAERDGEKYRVLAPLRRLNSDGVVYDLTRVIFEEFRLHPFAAHDDALDAMSRIYDVDPVPPMKVDAMVEERPSDSRYPDA